MVSFMQVFIALAVFKAILSDIVGPIVQQLR